MISRMYLYPLFHFFKFYHIDEITHPQIVFSCGDDMLCSEAFLLAYGSYTLPVYGEIFWSCACQFYIFLLLAQFCTIFEGLHNWRGVLDRNKLFSNNLPTVPCPYSLKVNRQMTRYVYIDYFYFSSLLRCPRLLFVFTKFSFEQTLKLNGVLFQHSFDSIFKGNPLVVRFSISFMICRCNSLLCEGKI